MKIVTETVVPFDEANQPDATPLKVTRRLIKVDFSALQMDDDEEDELSDGEPPVESDRKHRPNPWHRTGTAAPAVPAAPLTREEYHHYCDTALECTLPPQNACRVTAGCRIL